jgi:hypothetical protein
MIAQSSGGYSVGPTGTPVPYAAQYNQNGYSTIQTLTNSIDYLNQDKSGGGGGPSTGQQSAYPSKVNCFPMVLSKKKFQPAKIFY